MRYIKVILLGTLMGLTLLLALLFAMDFLETKWRLRDMEKRLVRIERTATPKITIEEGSYVDIVHTTKEVILTVDQTTKEELNQ
jgi:uncharacterized membrane protein YciS (DUF1049 family)